VPVSTAHGGVRCMRRPRWRTPWKRSVALKGEAGRDLLRRVHGIGVVDGGGGGTARPGAIRTRSAFGDLHVPHIVGTALVGHRLDDDGMAEVLAPYAPQRHRAVRYIEASGVRVQRFAPRFSPRDYRRF